MRVGEMFLICIVVEIPIQNISEVFQMVPAQTDAIGVSTKLEPRTQCGYGSTG